MPITVDNGDPIAARGLFAVPLTLQPLHPHFAAEVSGLDLREVLNPAELGELRAAADKYAVLVFRNQPFTNDEQLSFAERFDGTLHTKTSVSVLGKNRFGNEALTDISNVGEDGDLLSADDRRRLSTISNRLWHTDGSFQDPPGRYSMLSARVVPPVNADTEFADMRAAYDALDDDMRAELEGLTVHHSIVYSRHVMGFDFSQEEAEVLRGAVHPLVRHVASRRALYLASHASHVLQMPVPEADCCCGNSSSMRHNGSSSTAMSGKSTTLSSGTTGPRCIGRARSTIKNIAARCAALPHWICPCHRPTRESLINEVCA